MFHNRTEQREEVRTLALQAMPVRSTRDKVKDMAIFHCQAKAVSRSAGRSATASAAYRSGESIKDRRTGEVYDYEKKQGVGYKEIITPDGSQINRSELWNRAEEAEKRKDAKVAREWELALPSELTAEQRKDLACTFARMLVDRYGVVADVCIHEPSRMSGHGYGTSRHPD